MTPKSISAELISKSHVSQAVLAHGVFQLHGAQAGLFLEVSGVTLKGRDSVPCLPAHRCSLQCGATREAGESALCARH